MKPRLPWISLSLPLVLAAALLPACRQTGMGRSAREASAQAGSGFELQGTRLIACCCASPCPCRLNKKPMHCHGCDHTDVVHVERGHIGTTKMDGVTWVVAARSFAEDKAKNWAYVYVNEGASDEQMKALEGWFGEGAKALGAKAPYLIGKFVGMRKAPVRYQVSADRREYTTTIPGVLDLQMKAIVNPGRSEPVVSVGVMDDFGDRFCHADALVHKYDDAKLGYSWDLTGRQSNYADFKLDSRSAALGGRWGCWTANADLGDKGKYQEQMIEHDAKK
jgi:hypothetical protein